MARESDRQELLRVLKDLVACAHAAAHRIGSRCAHVHTFAKYRSILVDVVFMFVLRMYDVLLRVMDPFGMMSDIFVHTSHPSMQLSTTQKKQKK